MLKLRVQFSHAGGFRWIPLTEKPKFVSDNSYRISSKPWIVSRGTGHSVHSFERLNTKPPADTSWEDISNYYRFGGDVQVWDRGGDCWVSVAPSGNSSAELDSNKTYRAVVAPNSFIHLGEDKEIPQFLRGEDKSINLHNTYPFNLAIDLGPNPIPKLSSVTQSPSGPVQLQLDL